MDSPLTYNTVVPFLLAALPELQEGYEQERVYSRGAPITPYTLAMFVLVPALFKLLQQDEGHDTLRRAFTAVETLLQHPHKEISTLAATKVLKYFALSRPEIAARAEQYMGPASHSTAMAIRAWHADFKASKLQQELRAKERARTARTRRGRVD